MKLYAVEFLGFLTLDSYNSFFTIDKGSPTYATFIKNHAESENGILFAQNAIVKEMEKNPQEIFGNVPIIFRDFHCKINLVFQEKIKHMVGDGTSGSLKPFIQGTE